MSTRSFVLICFTPLIVFSLTFLALPLVRLFLASGEGAMLKDREGNTYFDGNSSIWTNLHGHRHPTIDAAIRDQLRHCPGSRPVRLCPDKLNVSAGPETVFEGTDPIAGATH